MPANNTHPRHIRRARRRRRAFTLIEIIVVVTIIAILAGIIVPKIMQNIGKASNASAAAEASSLAQQVKAYMLDMTVSHLDDQFTLDMLLLTPDDGSPGGPYLEKADDLNDPWKNPYMIRIPGEVNYTFDIVSAGEDGTFDTEDDVTN